jgi:uncharacterized protein (TIGR00730 family)
MRVKQLQSFCSIFEATMKSICVFCGARTGNDPAFMRLATETGAAIAQAGLTLVYGGGRVGLMGATADGAMAAGGKVVGIIPQFLADKEVEHRGLTEVHIVASMHERKTMMADLSDAFVALPGGAGTLEEIFEQWTWAQLGIHTKPVSFLNANGFYDPLIEMISRMKSCGFIQAELADMVVVENSIGAILDRLEKYEAPQKHWT